MNEDIAKGNFKQLKGKIKQQWGKLTDDEIDQMEGNAEILTGKLQERYGLNREDAERQAKEFRDRNDWNN
ncbi:MAG TPA: CsbD family protein [Steroidobacteraceae bacterium]|nr:CsbD family protein [Steroidobacteraceae bacterium]